ncbi:MAG TPA: Hsp70 family protein, partial [Stellaceae bacterium]|nr:Hsp70 family protein [Stellaceae bacterium]
YLAHLKNAFLYAGRVLGRSRDLSETEMVLTVPASFDAVARNLTAEAAEAAGLGKVILLEEPQAAFYAWIAQADREWRSLIAPGDIVLVCDVGGGTTDFSLIAVTDNNGTLELDRISVGEHILLGGDNMDLALAYTLQAFATLLRRLSMTIGIRSRRASRPSKQSSARSDQSRRASRYRRRRCTRRLGQPQPEDAAGEIRARPTGDAKQLGRGWCSVAKEPPASLARLYAMIISQGFQNHFALCAWQIGPLRPAPETNSRAAVS